MHWMFAHMIFSTCAALICFVEDFGWQRSLLFPNYRFNTDWSIRMLKIASCSLDRKHGKSLGTLETSDFRGF
jgi:hypothetical protein